MDTINGSSSMNNNYKLSKDELDKIIEDVDDPKVERGEIPRNISKIEYMRTII